MGRLSTLSDGANTPQAASYGPSGELLSIHSFVNEQRPYDSMLQLTGVGNGAVSISYSYSATQNNGKITSQTDNLSGEQIVYTYDALNRLASAQATSGAWGQSYNYDGFGNLTDQNVIAGSAPSYHVVPDPNTNHLGGEDPNGVSIRW